MEGSCELSGVRITAHHSIISEYVPRGNLRQYILSSHPFPWRLRLSFATDVARAVAYLHARQVCPPDITLSTLDYSFFQQYRSFV